MKQILDLCFLICALVFILCLGATLVLFLYFHTLPWSKVIYLQYTEITTQMKHLQVTVFISCSKAHMTKC